MLTPILNEPAKFTIEVLSPVTEIDELSFNSINGNLFAITSLSLFHTKTTSSNFSNSVSIFEILTPTISSTCALNPEPPVSELSAEEKERIKKEQDKIRRMRKGRRSTILTGPLGVQETEEDALETLLGK